MKCLENQPTAYDAYFGTTCAQSLPWWYGWEKTDTANAERHRHLRCDLTVERSLLDLDYCHYPDEEMRRAKKNLSEEIKNGSASLRSPGKGKPAPASARQDTPLLVGQAALANCGVQSMVEHVQLWPVCSGVSGQGSARGEFD
jgi:hypothetical protein